MRQIRDFHTNVVALHDLPLLNFTPLPICLLFSLTCKNNLCVHRDRQKHVYARKTEWEIEIFMGDEFQTI